MPDTIIIGGGIIGLSIASYLAKEKQKVLLIEKAQCGRQTSWAAAGLLTPVNELEFLETDVLKYGLKSLQMYPGFISELGEDVGFREDGTLAVGLEEDDRAYLRRMYEYQKDAGLETFWMEADDLRNQEQGLSSRIEFGIFCRSDVQVDNHLLVDALRRNCIRSGVEVRENEEALMFLSEKNRVTGVKTEQSGYYSENVVAATGVFPLGNESFPFKIRPVRGQVIELERAENFSLKKNIRIWNKTLGWGYIVPKYDRIVCGSTGEEMGDIPCLTAGGMMDILRKCYAAVPSVYDLNIKTVYAGLRPATIDHKPVIGRGHLEGLLIANGMYRHGILFAPLTGKAIGELIVHNRITEEIKGFSPDRFACLLQDP